METVSKLVDAGYKAIWGPGDVDTRTEVQHDERRQSEDQSKETSGVASTPSIKVIDAGKQSLWPGTSNMNIPHAEGEEPVSGVTGKGTSTDPYDAGNRDEQPEAPPIDIGDARTQAVEHQTEGNSVASNSSPPRLDLTMDPDIPIARDTGDTSSKFLGVPGHDQALGGTTGCEPKSESGVGKDQSESEKLARGLREIQLSKDHDTTISFETSSTEAICDSPGVESDVKTASASEDQHTTYPRDETAAVATSSFTNPVNSVSDPGRSDSSSSSTSPSSSSSSSAGEDGVGSNVEGAGHKRAKSKILAKVKEKLDIGKHRHSKHSRSAKASLGK
jgi:hypothetical protein